MMAIYRNRITRVVHWLGERRGWPAGTACAALDQFMPSWNWLDVDSLGVPADVTCCKCRETSAFLDAAAEAAKGE